MNLLQEIYFGNTLQEWIVALSTFAVIFTVLKILQTIATRKLSKLASLTSNQIDDLLVSMLKQTKIFILIVASAYIASHAITLKPSIEVLWEKAVILILIVQGGLWISAGITFWLGRTLQKQMDRDTSSATTISFL
ncbi:MAG: hypothetical protein WC373_15740, partial [Smithella sp.]